MLDRLAVPIVQAPMARGVSTPALAAAVSGAGGLGFLATGYRSPEAVAAELDELRALTGAPFGVNLFSPTAHPADREAVTAYARRIGADPAEARFDDDGYGAKLELVLRERPAVVSFVFGCPEADVVRRLRDAGVAVWATVTTPGEAAIAAARGVDAIVVQGVEAGGHRGTFGDEADDYGLLALLQLVRDGTGLPLVAAGGIATGAAVAAVLAAGAAAAQLGTAFMRCPESGTAAAHREWLDSDTPTALTRAFSGRLARGLVNDFMREHSDHAPEAYPELVHLTAPIRRAGDPQRTNLWAGQAHRLAAELPAADVVATLAGDAREALRRAGGSG
jgi:nitronate monooxygenase